MWKVSGQAHGSPGVFLLLYQPDRHRGHLPGVALPSSFWALQQPGVKSLGRRQSIMTVKSPPTCFPGEGSPGRGQWGSELGPGSPQPQHSWNWTGN